MNQSIITKIKAFIEKYSLQNQVLLVGFSGGVDSLCLLDVLYKLSDQYNFKLIAGHINHNWRGAESKQEEDNAKKYCEERNITFVSETLPEDLPHTELEARNQRYIFFNKISEKFNVTAILTGHTLTDQVETILYRITKGTGLNGLKGIPEVRKQENTPDIYRPILELTRKETLEYCQQNDLSPNIDSSNSNQDYLRNRIRHSLVPELKTYNNKVEDAILRLSAVALESEELINEYIEQIKDKVYLNCNEICSNEFLKLSLPARKRIIMEFLVNNNIEYDFEKIDEINNFIENSKGLKSGNTLSLTTNKWLFASSQIIKIINYIKSDVLKFSLVVELNKENFHPELKKTITITEWDEGKPDKFPLETAAIIYADLSLIKEPLYLRTRQNGDVFQPFGMKEKVRLKKYLINKGVPEFERDSIPILCTDSEILWVYRVGMSEMLRVRNIPTHKIQIS